MLKQFSCIQTVAENRTLVVKTLSLFNVIIGNCAILFEDFPRNIPACNCRSFNFIFTFFFPKTVFVKRKMQNVSELSLSFQMHCIIH